jgi:exosortase A-associated hydrolase 2
MPATFEPFFLKVDDTALGARLAIYHPPAQGHARGMVVHVHAFAEEMNKSRRMVATQARALAAAGFAVLQLDLLGCGDSAGDFGDTTWLRWVEDVCAAARWLQQHELEATDAAPAPLWVWGLRAGTLLATEAAARMAEDGTCCNLLFWQPAPVGRLLLQQFLRLKAAGDLAAGQAKAAMEQLRAQIAAGQPVEVAGYQLAPALCHGLEQARLEPPAGIPTGRVVWLEVSAVEQPTLAPAGAATLAGWRAAGWSVQAQAIRGPAFWQTTEIEDAPDLVAATMSALQTGALPAAIRPEAASA